MDSTQEKKMILKCPVCGESIVDYNIMKKIEKIIEKFKHKEIASTKFTAYEIDAMATALA